MAVPTLKCMLLHEDTADALLWALTKIAVVDVPPTIRRLLSRGEILALRKGVDGVRPVIIPPVVK
eukprot:9963395-Prorocentrum_lima.AAC.1